MDGDRPLTARQLADLRQGIARLSEHSVRERYRAAWQRARRGYCKKDSGGAYWQVNHDWLLGVELVPLG